MARTAQFVLFIGTNGTGKSTQMKKFLSTNERNLIVPANKIDHAWDKVKELKAKEVELKLPGKQAPQQINVYPYLNKFKGTRKVFCYDNNDVHSILDIYDKYPERSFVKGGIFLDDFKNYIATRGPLPTVVRKIFSDRRHRELDIFMAAHSWQYVNPELFSFQPICVVFKVTQPITNDLKSKVSNIAELEAIQKDVNEKAKTNPYYYRIFKPE